MFDLSNKTLIRSCYTSLDMLWKESPSIFIELFFQEKDIRLENKYAPNNLVKVGLIRQINRKFRATVFIIPLSGKFIVSDFLISLHRTKNGRYLRRKDNVWTIYAYESPYIAKKVMVKSGDVVLDLATGSGIIALFCADKAKHVIATDINPKAINYAKFNAILNGLDDKIEFRTGNLFEPVKGEKFDLIIWNGPTLATPNIPEKYPIYCFGGADGLDFTRKFIRECPLYLKPGGRIQWLDPSLGDYLQPESMKIIKEEWKNKSFKVIYEQRVKPSNLLALYSVVDKALLKPTKGLARPLWLEPLTEKEYADWISFLKQKNFTHIHAGMYMVSSSENFQLVRTKPRKILFPNMNYLPQDWHFLGKGRIMQLLKVCEQY